MNLVEFFAGGDQPHPVAKGYAPVPFTHAQTWTRGSLSARLDFKTKTNFARITLMVKDQPIATVKLSGVELSEANWWFAQLKLMLQGKEVKL